MTYTPEQVIANIEELTAEITQTFSGLSNAQLNWQVSADSWSIAQCLEHVIISHGMYIPVLNQIAKGKYQPSLWARISPFSGIFGRFFVKVTLPDNPKKVKTSPKAYPASSNVAEGILNRYTDHQKEMIAALQKIPASVEPAKTIITSPLLGVVTYSLANFYALAVGHGRRHFNQARRVMENEGFPAE